MGEYQGDEGIERKLGGNKSGQKDSLDGWAIEPQPCPEQEEGRATLFCVGRQSSGIFFPSSLSNREWLPTRIRMFLGRRKSMLGVQPVWQACRPEVHVPKQAVT